MAIRKVVLVAALAVCAWNLEAKRPLVVQDETLGINVVPPEEAVWQSHTIDMYRKHVPEDMKPRPGEFFELEYGKPLDAFAFTNGWSRLWGMTKNDPDLPGIRFGRGWGDYVMCQWAFVVDIEQDVPESKWKLYTYTDRHVGCKNLTFKTGAAGRKTLTIPMGMIQHPIQTKGLRLVCSDTNAVKGTVHSLKAVATEIRVSYRHRFTLKEKPAFAGVSFPGCPHSDLYVNGQLIWHGINVRGGGGTLSQPIADKLAVGENEVVFVRDAGAGWGVNTACTLELFTVSEQGETWILPSDKGWECRYADGEWKPAKVGPIPGVHHLFNGKPYQSGPNPMHAGALQVKPRDIPFPVFDEKEENVWSVWYPQGVKDAAVTAEVRDAFTGEKVGGWRLEVEQRNIRFRGLKAGAYDVVWSLVAGGKTVDTVKTEMVVAGPLGLKEFERDEIEPYLQTHKKLVWSVDPTEAQWMNVSSNFIGHSGMLAAPTVEMGRVLDEAGVKVRETGASDGAYFAWHVNVGKLGAPHIVEIDYPDTREQVVYSTISETYPYDFCNNGSPYENAFPNATGSVRTGGRAPLTGQVKTLRYVFFPGSRNATVTFESGLVNKPAACAAIRIYELDAPLPAWRLPKTDRIFMNHSEHALFGIWGSWRSPVCCSAGQWGAYEPYRWSALYAATVNRIQQLKFEGHNASVEGVYMYSNGFSTFNGESNEAHESFDLCYLIAKMYRANGIKFFAGFEYLASPKLAVMGAYDTSEREVWEGRGKEPAHLVDKDGRITIGFGGMGLDDRHPYVRTSLTNLLSAIYRRYDGLGVAGLYVISGGWWIPGLCTDGVNTSEDVGYGDSTVAAFERDTGISLGTGAVGKERFRKRYELLTGRYKYEWRLWRSRRMRGAMEELQDVVRSGKDDWQLYAVSGPHIPRVTPFTSLDSTPYQRDAYMSDMLGTACFEPVLYGSGASTDVKLVPHFCHLRERGGPHDGMIVSRSARDVVRSSDALYLTPTGLNERYNLTDGLKGKPWWWRRTTATVYEVKYQGAAAYSDFVDILGEYTPKMLVHTWLDCNHCTAHDAALRDFLSGYYATPLGEPLPYRSVTGADAHLYGGKLQLVNDTAWPLRAESGDVTLAPYAVKVLDTPRAFAFRFEPAVAARVKADLDALLADKPVLSRIRSDIAAELVRCAKEDDLYRAEVLMAGWEVQNVLERARKSGPALANQALLEKALKEDGTVRINCGCIENVKDERGRLWLSDQSYTGFGAYGNEFANVVDRGPIPIANTDIPTPYRTEAGALAVAYHIPVPAGRYRAVLHFAETWDTLPGRVLNVTVNGVAKKVVPWDAGGRYAASTVTWEDVALQNGRIEIYITGSAIINGIELFRFAE